MTGDDDRVGANDIAAEFVDVPFAVEASYDGWRLDRYLTAKLKHLSRHRVQQLITTAVRAEARLKPSSIVHKGQQFIVRRQAHAEPDTPKHVTIVHNDEALVVVDKPAGLPVHPTARYHHGTLVHLLRRLDLGWVEPAHRLDRETSGLLLCARSPQVSRYFMRLFQRREVHKEYLAICEGSPPDELVVDAPLSLGGKIVRLAMRVDHAHGRAARTRFVVVRRFTVDDCPFALVRVHPETGRQHQIRAHLREAGFPLVGDKIYGPDEILYDRFVRHTLSEADWLRLRLPRQALHAHRLCFVHPQTHELVCFEAPLPEDLSQFLPPNDAVISPTPKR